MLESNLYIACLNLSSRPTLVVGAGSVGLEKINGLLACGARVKVVAPDVHPDVDELSDVGAIELHRRVQDLGVALAGSGALMAFGLAVGGL